MNDTCVGQAISPFLGSACREPTVSERLAERKAKLEDDLARVNEAIRLLESQPGVAEVLNALAKLGVR